MSEKKVVRKKKRWGKSYEYTPITRELTMDDETAEAVKKDLKNLKAVTPESFANKHSLKVSVARAILREQVEEGKIKLVSKGSRTEIYSA